MATCSRCTKDVADEKYPMHVLMHKAQEMAPPAAASKPTPSPGEDPVTLMPDPEEVRAHIKTCPTCADKWKPHLKDEQPPPPPPAQAAAPAPPKRIRVGDLRRTSLHAHGIEAIEEGDGVALRVRDEADGQAAVEDGVVPKCRWVKDTDGWHYACEG